MSIPFLRRMNDPVDIEAQAGLCTPALCQIRNMYYKQTSKGQRTKRQKYKRRISRAPTLLDSGFCSRPGRSDSAEAE
jgi:hypothetical protein